MDLRPSRALVSTIAAVLVAVAAATALVSADTGIAAAQAPVGPPESIGATPWGSDPIIERVDVHAGGVDQAMALAGTPHRIEVDVTVANPTQRPLRDLVVTVEHDGRTRLAEPMTIPGGEVAVARLTVDATRWGITDEAVVVRAGPSTATVVHRQVPWALAGLGVLAAHVLVVHGRDRLRARVARSGGLTQPSPSQTWARSRRYSDTS